MKSLPIFLLLLTFLSCKKETLDLIDLMWCGEEEYIAGDSMVEGPGAVSFPLQFGVLKNNDAIQVGTFEGKYQLYLRDQSVINAGVSGQTSTEVADRVEKDPRRIGRNIITWAGRNNPYQHDQIIADIDRIIAGNPKYLVLEVLNGTWVEEGIGYPRYNNIVELNNKLAARYGRHFVWLKTYLQSFALPSDSIYIARDQIPQSLIAPNDSLHLATIGYKHVAEITAMHLLSCDNTAAQ